MEQLAKTRSFDNLLVRGSTVKSFYHSIIFKFIELSRLKKINWKLKMKSSKISRLIYLAEIKCTVKKNSVFLTLFFTFKFCFYPTNPIH